MALKPKGGICSIREQIIDDPVSGLTLQFERYEDGRCVLRIFGNLPFGNREIGFEDNGSLGWTGTSLAGKCRANWLKEV